MPNQVSSYKYCTACNTLLSLRYHNIMCELCHYIHNYVPSNSVPVKIKHISSRVHEIK